MLNPLYMPAVSITPASSLVTITDWVEANTPSGKRLP